MATYTQYWWNRAETDDKHYIHQMESVQQIVETSEVRLRKSVQKVRALSVMQQRELDEDKEEVGFGKRSTNVGAMNRLANDLVKAIDTTGSYNSVLARYKIIKAYADNDPHSGPFMSYSTFRLWVSGQRTNNLEADWISVARMYVDELANEKGEKLGVIDDSVIDDILE